jgi:hypothetical protein
MNASSCAVGDHTPGSTVDHWALTNHVDDPINVPRISTGVRGALHCPRFLFPRSEFASRRRTGFRFTFSLGLAGGDTILQRIVSESWKEISGPVPRDKGLAFQPQMKISPVPLPLTFHVSHTLCFFDYLAVLLLLPREARSIGSSKLWQP